MCIFILFLILVKNGKKYFNGTEEEEEYVVDYNNESCEIINHTGTILFLFIIVFLFILSFMFNEDLKNFLKENS